MYFVSSASECVQRRKVSVGASSFPGMGSTRDAPNHCHGGETQSKGERIVDNLKKVMDAVVMAAV